MPRGALAHLAVVTDEGDSVARVEGTRAEVALLDAHLDSPRARRSARKSDPQPRRAGAELRH